MKNKAYFAPAAVCAGVFAAAAAAMFFISPVCSGICLAAGGVVTGVFVLYSGKRLRELEKLNDYLALVCGGKYSLDVPDNSEGELSILKNNLYKVIVLLRSSIEALTDEKRFLSDSLADISHQLKTPLTSMMVLADLLEEEEDPEKRREFTATLTAQLERTRWLVTTLLKLSRFDAGAVELGSDPVSVGDVVRDSLAPFLIIMDIKNIELRQSGGDFTFAGDKNWSVEAVQNVVKNCVEHMPDGGTLGTVTSSNAVYDELIIRDSGGGIDEKDLPHIFERFYHGGIRDGGSVGIGLALTETILKRENAVIDAYNENGAVFRIRFRKSVV